MMQVEQAQISENGRIVIPAAYRKAMGLKGGEVLTISLDEDGLHLQSRKQVLTRAQGIVKALYGPDRSPSAELIADRRKETKQEEKGG